jgi:transcriptional regulator with XRE-family HTH domain
MKHGGLRIMTLGEYLRQAREGKTLSLRAVEELTGISNAFLSQLESGKVKQPSPMKLHKLASVYGVEYETLMEVAGYPVPRPTKQNDAFVFGRLGKVTPNEGKALQEYLRFLRSQQKKVRRQR